MSQYEMKNWKKICEEKDAEIKKLKEISDRIIERIDEELDFSVRNFKEEELMYRKGLRYARRIVNKEVENAQSK